MTQHPFDEAYKNCIDIPTETLKRNLAANVYGVETWQKKAVEFILKEREEKQSKVELEKEQAEQKERIQNDFDLTKQNIKATNSMARWTFLLAIGTGLIAICTIFSCFISFNSDKRENVRLKSELRPYLVPQLSPDVSTWLQKDKSSQLFLILYDNQYLILPFRIKNVGRIPAININAKYDSPAQKAVLIELGENNIAPDAETPETFLPHFNIQNVVNDKAVKQFEMDLKISYQGNDEIDSRTYCSSLKLVVTKMENGIYDIKGTDLKFGYE